MRRIIAILAAVAAVVARPAAAEPIKLVTGNGYIPYADEDLPNGGLVTEIVRKAYERAGYAVEIDFLPWRRGEQLMAAGERIGTFPYVETEARNRKYLYSDPILVATERPVVHERDAGQISSYADLKGKTLCLPVGWKSGDSRLTAMIARGAVETVKPKTMDACLRMLKSKRADFTTLEEHTAAYKLENGTGAAREIHVEDLALSRNSLHMIFSKSVPRAKTAVITFNKALDRLRESGAYDTIVAKHLGPGTS